jgi:pimeloyl-ACP methyl ester carboxylesterase
MAHADINGLRIEYDTIGKTGDRPLVLVAGLVTQLVGWPDPFCNLLASAGHFVVRFDHRDCGLSTKLESLGAPDPAAMAADLAAGRPVTPPYSLSDMAGDTLGLMDVLGLGRAHICGFSMGGMIGQVMALEHPERMISLTSMASSTGEKDLPGSTPEAVAAMVSAPPVDRSAYIDYMAEVVRAFSGGSDRYDETLQKEIAARAYDRSFYPIGFTRQMAAIETAPGRRRLLGGVSVPTLVIHGDSDSLVPLRHGEDTARAIPGARLVVVEGMGHGIAVPSLWDEIVSVIADHTRMSGT